MNLARPFKAGKGKKVVASLSDVLNPAEINRRYATRVFNRAVPALKGRAKFMPTLRAEEHLISAS